MVVVGIGLSRRAVYPVALLYLRRVNAWIVLDVHSQLPALPAKGCNSGLVKGFGGDHGGDGQVVAGLKKVLLRLFNTPLPEGIEKEGKDFKVVPGRRLDSAGNGH